MVNTHGHGSSQNLCSNEGASSFIFANSLGDEEHTPSRQKGKKHKDNEVFSPERDVNFLMNPKRQHVSKFQNGSQLPFFNLYLCHFTYTLDYSFLYCKDGYFYPLVKIMKKAYLGHFL